MLTMVYVFAGIGLGFIYFYIADIYKEFVFRERQKWAGEMTGQELAKDCSAITLLAIVLFALGSLLSVMPDHILIGALYFMTLTRR